MSRVDNIARKAPGGGFQRTAQCCTLGIGYEIKSEKETHTDKIWGKVS